MVHTHHADDHYDHGNKTTFMFILILLELTYVLFGFIELPLVSPTPRSQSHNQFQCNAFSRTGKDVIHQVIRLMKVSEQSLFFL